jgi:hypothetical protein
LMLVNAILIRRTIEGQELWAQLKPEDFRALTPLLMAVYRSVPAGAPFKASNDAEQRPKAPPKHRGETTCSLPKLTLMRKSAVSPAIKDAANATAAASDALADF